MEEDKQKDITPNDDQNSTVPPEADTTPDVSNNDPYRAAPDPEPIKSAEAQTETSIGADTPPTPAPTETQPEASSSAKNPFDHDETQPVVPTPVAASQPMPEAASKKRQMLLVALAVAILLAGAVTAWWLVKSNTTPVDSANDSAVEHNLGVAVTVADGEVEYLHGEEWQELSVDSDVQLAEGDSVRTGKDSRAILTLDDGSAVRLDAETVVKLTSLFADDVRIEQSGGEVYSRVVASDRKYTVSVDDTTYEAQGTAFVTIKQAGVSGVQVFQSAVKASGVDEAVAEGKQYYVANSNSKLSGKVTGIELANLVSNKFVAWNLAQDKKDARFKDKLGVLSKFDEVAAEQAAKRKAEAERKKAEELARQEAAEKARLEAERRQRESQYKISARISDGGIAWTYAKEAKYGFKVVYSTSDTTPTLFEDKAVYVSEPVARWTHMPKDFKPGHTYYIRVCAYDPNHVDGPCLDYSDTFEYSIAN